MNSTLFLEIRHVDSNIKTMKLGEIIDIIPVLREVKDKLIHVMHSTFNEAGIRVDLFELIVPTSLFRDVVMILFTGDMSVTEDRNTYMDCVIQYTTAIMRKKDISVDGPYVAGDIGYFVTLENCDLGRYTSQYHFTGKYAIH